MKRISNHTKYGADTRAARNGNACEIKCLAENISMVILALHKVVHELRTSLFSYTVTNELENPGSNVGTNRNSDSVGACTLKLGSGIAHAIKNWSIQGLDKGQGVSISA